LGWRPPMAELIEDQFVYRAIIGRQSGEEILLVTDPHGWTLPHGTTRDHHPADVTSLRRALRDELGVDATVLRCLDASTDGTTASQVFELDARSDAQRAAHTRWFRRTEIAAIALAEQDRVVLTSTMPAAVVDGQGWTRAEWWDEAVAWITDQLDQRGAGGIRQIEQIRAWEFSCVLRVRTGRDVLYFKALPHSMAM